MFQECIYKFIHDRMIALPDSINSMMDFKLVKSDERKQTLVLSFPVKQWQINPMNTMHGGMIATAFDITMGCLSYACNGGNPNPTIEMQVRYLKGIKEGESIDIHASVLHVGKRMIQLQAYAYQGDQSVIVAQASASYMINSSRTS